MTAARLWVDNPEYFSSLVLLAGIPAGSDDFASREVVGSDERIVSIAGSQDGRIDVASVEEGIVQMREGDVPVYGFEVMGMNHMQWTTGITASELENDFEASISDEEALERGRVMLDVALDDLIVGGELPLLEMSNWAEGVAQIGEGQ